MSEETRLNVKLDESMSRTYTKTQTVGKATVKGYVTAMVDLWRQQQRMKINNHPSPRDDAVVMLLKVTEDEEDDRRRINVDDRGTDAMLDGYTTTKQIENIAVFFWGNSRVPEESFRNYLAFCFRIMR
ncbi:hypothetical protein PHMEG_00015984 [Phytophthora megakarya]|uniref:Uncharacterized protein n=1 Tax=Phytophthora megakarya TaxID=4795 RepID=A0A225W0D7_9STRA|nr:hypothetical protein PHMEG_00015984 [Phytophthora megakarya]